MGFVEDVHDLTLTRLMIWVVGGLVLLVLLLFSVAFAIVMAVHLAGPAWHNVWSVWWAATVLSIFGTVVASLLISVVAVRISINLLVSVQTAFNRQAADPAANWTPYIGAVAGALIGAVAGGIHSHVLGLVLAPVGAFLVTLATALIDNRHPWGGVAVYVGVVALVAALLYAGATQSERHAWLPPRSADAVASELTVVVVSLGILVAVAVSRWRRVHRVGAPSGVQRP